MSEAIYVITHYKHNHEETKNELDSRFLQSDKNFIYYLIDKEVPSVFKNKKTVLEHEIDPDLSIAGAKFFAEWSFLLAEEKHAFCEYPFFMISSRFYEKNRWLTKDLATSWDTIFSYFKDYDWGYLPSYDRPLRWIDLSWKKHVKKEAWNYRFFPFRAATFDLIKEVFQVDIPRDYRYTADLFCNYMGFKNREALLSYVRFYKPLIERFFDRQFRLSKELDPYIQTTGSFRREKPFTFLVELISHLFFFKEKKKYFALHYNGYYSIDEEKKKFVKLEKIPSSLSFKKQVRRKLGWHWRHLKSESIFSPWFEAFNRFALRK